jgi:hypothetical protein
MFTTIEGLRMIVRGLVEQVIEVADVESTSQGYVFNVTVTGAVPLTRLAGVQSGPRFVPVKVTIVPPRIVPLFGVIESIVGVIPGENVILALELDVHSLTVSW